MNAVPFDFRQPPGGSLESKVAAWLADACKIAPPTWANLLPSATLSAGKVDSVTVATWVKRLPDQCIGVSCRLRLGASDDNNDNARWLFALPRRLYLGLIVTALGESLPELPTDRVPSSIEEALGDHLFRQLFLWPLQEAWPIPDLTLDPTERGLPRKVCTLPPTDVALAATLKVEASFGAHSIEVLLPRGGMVQDLLHSNGRGVNGASLQSHMEALVRDMATPFAVDLGSTEVTMARLQSLAEGDLLILGQRVTEPLTAKIGDSAKYRVWPGTVGNRQAVRVESTISN